MINYKCLVLDHDDTIFDSTRSVHYPAFIETLTALRPDKKDLPFDEFIEMCHTHGFEKICDDIYHFDDQELKIEYEIWKSYTKKTIPQPFDGIAEILKRYVELGGKIVVVSHSESSEIKRDYKTHFGFEPDMVFGWELGSDQRKPHAYPLLQTLELLHLKAKDCLVLDDMRLGKEMAEKVNVDFVCAAWAHRNEKIQNDMKKLSPIYLENVEDLAKIIFK
jgi:phosphoglycolate phosphatase-like HAD superfamily hydrolase